MNPKMAPLVHAMTSADLVVLGSCCGRGLNAARVDFAARGPSGLRHVAACLRRARHALRGRVYLDVALDVDDPDGGLGPEWIRASLRIESARSVAGSPSPRLLQTIAEAFRTGGARQAEAA